MEFDFSKTKPSPFILDELMNSRHRNPDDMRGSSAIADFLQQTNINQQQLIPNPEIESSQFSGLPYFHPSQNGSQIPQVMFDQESLPSNDESFLLPQSPSGRKDDSDKHTNSKKYFQPMDALFEPCANSPQNAPSPSPDLQISSRFNQQPFQYQNKIVSIDKADSQHLQEKSAISTEILLQNNERPVEHSVSDQMQEGNISCQKTTHVSARGESLTNFNAEIHEFTESFTKLLTEKAELKKQISHTEVSLKEYREQSLDYKNKYEDIEEKLKEEIKNRETILTQVEYVNNVSQLLDKHFKDISNTLKLYGDINNEYKEQNTKLNDHAEKQVKEYESVLSSYKITTEKLKSQILKLEKQNNETSIEFSRAKEVLTQQIEEANSNLNAEKNRSIIFEKNLLALEQTNKELMLKQEQSENNFSERYTSLELKFEDAKNKLEMIEKNNVELKMYETKYKHLETFVEKLQQEKEALVTILDASQRNLSKSETERSEHLKSIDKLYLERENSSKATSKLKEECADLNWKMMEIETNYEQLFNENEVLRGKYEALHEDLESYKVSKLKLEEEIKEAKMQEAMSTKAIQKMKNELNDLHKDLEVVRVEVTNKSDQIISLKKELSSLEAEKEELQLVEKDLREEVAEKELKIGDMVTLNSSLEIDLNKHDELNTQIREELRKAKSDMVNTRQEMLASVDQYREQFMSELRENEDCRKELQSKYETTCSELEKIVENKKQCDSEIFNLQQSIKLYENKINVMDNETKKLKLEQKKKENDLTENISKLTVLISKLEEEKVLLEKSVHELRKDLNSKEMLLEKSISLEKQIDILQQENKELKEKLKIKERETLTQRDFNTSFAKNAATQKLPGALPVSKKRVCFDEELMSDASSIDLPNFFKTTTVTTLGQDTKTSATNAKKDDTPKNRRMQRIMKGSNSGRKFFKKSRSGFDDQDIFA